MTATDKEIAVALRGALRKRLGDERYELWFERSARLICSEVSVDVVCRSAFVVELVKRQFHNDLLGCCQATLGHRSDPNGPRVGIRATAARGRCWQHTFSTSVGNESKTFFS